jgi:hypothetical protein
MYAVRLRVDPKAAKTDGEVSKVAQEVTNSLIEDLPLAKDADVSSIPISAGNPRVEHVTGVVHLYKEIPTRAEIETGAWKKKEEV